VDGPVHPFPFRGALAGHGEDVGLGVPAVARLRELAVEGLDASFEMHEAGKYSSELERSQNDGTCRTQVRLTPGGSPGINKTSTDFSPFGEPRAWNPPERRAVW